MLRKWSCTSMTIFYKNVFDERRKKFYSQRMSRKENKSDGYVFGYAAGQLEKETGNIE